MKSPYLGKNGHIAVRTNYIERAVNYLSTVLGVEFNEDSAKKDDKGNPIFTTGWQDGEQNIDFSKATVDEVFGVRNKNMVGFEKEDSAYKRNPKVELESFNFLTAYLSVLVMIVALVFSMLGLVKRVFDIVMLFITLPLVSATIPLDDGARFQVMERYGIVESRACLWRSIVCKRIFVDYANYQQFAVRRFRMGRIYREFIQNLSYDGWRLEYQWRTTFACTSNGNERR